MDVDVNGRDIFLFQALHDPTSARSIDQNIMAFLIALRALREWGANHVTGLLPYLAYARQDKPTKFQREPTTAELMADLSIEAGLDRLVTWDPHTPQVHGFYGSVPIDALSPLALFTDEFQRFRNRDDVIVIAPDAGAAKYVTRFARALNVSSAVASKYRPQPEEAVISEIMGDFTGKRVALVLDDMIATGGTIEATVTKLVEDKGIEQVYLGISHNLCSQRALQRLSDLHANYHLQKMVVTNSIPQAEDFLNLPFLNVRDLSDLLSRIINRIHHNRSVDGILAEPLVAAEG
jgi:ribose-phosphate pyrophosphokinase